ncbi:MAG: type I secretion system permease/ATPase [Desulfobacula sp.]|jgi:PrtD family type I secretion system ABC transporter|nr:type I secretion system permease/ATPase [Desulfobacula sp.]
MIVFLKKWKKYFTFAALLSCFVNILQLTFPFYMFTIYRNIIISYSEFSLANITFAAFFAVAALGFFSYLRSRLLALAGKDLNLEMRQTVYSGMVKGCVIDSNRSYKGGLNDLDTLGNYFSSPSIYSLFDAPWAPFYLALIYLFHPVLGIIATLGAVVMVGLSVLQENLIRRSMKDANITNSKNQRFVESFMRNAEVINGMGMIPNISDRFIRGNKKVMMNQTKSSYYAGAIQSMIKPLQNVIQVLIYCFGAYYAMTQGFNVGLMVAASIIMGRGLAPLMQVMSSWRFMTQARESYKRLKGFAAFADQQAKTMPLPEPQGDINVTGAVFRIGESVLLKGVSFGLKKGEFLGIIGPSGAGKTTLCRLLLGVWPSMGGKVYLDGKDIFLWDKEEIGQYIGYLPQEIELFPGTVAENIARLGKVDDKDLEKAIEISGIKDMVESFPEGVLTQLEGEKGLKLSGGQKQKIGLARAVYGNPRFLVLDEPTSNLDEQGEQQLLRTLLEMKQKGSCTCIMVTHKQSLLRSMDKMLVLQDGRVAMFGPKDAVFAKLAGQVESEAAA